MLNKRLTLSALALSMGAIVSAQASAETLRLLTWGGYAPQEVIELFEKETGIEVKVTKSNNEDMISKLRATGGSGFDLAQPSQDRITGVQQQFGIYQAIDLTRIEQQQMITSMLDATKKNTAVGDQVFGVPHVWGTSGLVVNGEMAKDVADYTDLCQEKYKGKVSYRLKRPTLIGFAFALGEDPFAAYSDPAKYQQILNQVEQKLVECKPIVKAYWSGGDELMNLMRSNEVVAAMAWDAGGWKLNRDQQNIQFVAPKSGALGWIDTFAIPRKSKAVDAAYQWINFVMRPEIAAKITESAGNFTASKGSDAYVNEVAKAQFNASFSSDDIDNIKWYPAVPAGLEAMEGKVLDRVQAAK